MPDKEQKNRGPEQNREGGGHKQDGGGPPPEAPASPTGKTRKSQPSADEDAIEPTRLRYLRSCATRA